MSQFRNGLVAGALIVSGLVMWQPSKAKEWGWSGRKFLTALPEKFSKAFGDEATREKISLVEKLRRKKVILNAKGNLGVKYVLGGDDPKSGFDCSGLVQHVMWQNGIKTPRLVSDQFEKGKEVDLDDIEEGDLLFFQVYSSANAFGRGMNKLTRYVHWAPNHVGIYLGNGKMIHAPRTGKKVESVKVDSGFWKEHLIAARDPF